VCCLPEGFRTTPQHQWTITQARVPDDFST
jgi:hypothetical protein